MDCDQVAELLPWLLNGTLDVAEEQQARAHLATCEICRQELDEAISVWPVFGQHVPVEALIDQALKRPTLSPAPELIEEHLAKCQECAVRFKSAQKSVRWVREGTVEPWPPKIKWWEAWRRRLVDEAMPSGTRRPAIGWQYAALAASFVALIAAGGWLWSWRQARVWRTSSTEQQRATGERLTNLEADNQRARQSEAQLRRQQDETNQLIAQLQEKVKESSAPQINIPLLYVQPSEPVRYKSGDQPASRPVELRIPPGAKSVVLILNSQTPDTYRRYRIEMLDAQGAAKWGASGLARSPSNDYTISVPAESLVSGASYTFNVYGESKGRSIKVESYRVRVK